MTENNLTSNVWLTDMFAIRNMWVPAYFRELPIRCLMKATSRCESSNAHFKVNTTSSNTLVQFLLGYDSSLDNQRYNQRIEEFKSNTCTPDLKTGFEIELHASRVYTRTIFSEVQKEILKGMFNCFINNVDIDDHSKVFTISHMDRKGEYVNEFEVLF
jgi:hypothetical protein